NQFIFINPIRFYYNIDFSMRNKLEFAVGINSKKIKLAVNRNRTKRIIREAYRIQKKLLFEDDFLQNKHISIFALYTSSEIPIFINMHNIVHQFLIQIKSK
ncbi:MAG: ribonuclease P protein component, partial [Sediminibacterium sp.]|nr:ribonuclease P protein component [Sediminibacterium sp.]